METDHIHRYIRRTETQFEKNWRDYESKLEKFLTQKTEGQMKDWVQRKDEMGKMYWTNLKTLTSQVEHPGVKIFELNKKALKVKAKEELDKNLESIEERKAIIMEAMIGLRSKVSVDVSKMRLTSAMKTRRERQGKKWLKQ